MCNRGGSSSLVLVLCTLALGIASRAAWAAGVTTCGNGVAATVGDDVDCTVAPGLIPTTVTFSSTPLKTLILNGAAPTGNVTNVTNGQGVVIVQGTVTSAAKFGSSLFHYLESQAIQDGATFNLGHELSAITVAVGQGTSGVLNQSAGFLNASSLILSAGATLTQSNSGVIQTEAITLGNNASLALRNQSAGTIDGAAAGQGSLTFSGNYDTDATLGATNSLASITVADGGNLTLDQNARATGFTVGQGASGTVSQSAGTLTTTTLAIGAGGSFSQSGTGILNASSMTIGSGGSLTLRNQGSGTIDGAAAGQGSLTFSGNYDTDATLGATNSLASITVADGGNLTLDQNARATGFTVGQGASGTVSQSAGTLTTTTLAIGAGGSFSQSGTGILNASSMTIGSGGSLTLRNQGSGTIDGAAAGQGSLTFTGNYDTDATLGGTNGLAMLTVASGATLALDQNATATSFVANGTVNHAAGALNASTLTIGSGGLFNQAGGGLTAATTILDGGTMRLVAPLSHTGSLTVGGGSSGVLDLGGNTLTTSSSFTMRPGSTLKCAINSDTANDSGRIVAAGQALVAAGSRIDLAVAPATLTLGQRYVIVAGGAGGAVSLPATIIDNIVAYKFVASTDGDALTLTVQKAADYLEVARSATTSAVAAALMAIADHGTSSDDMRSVLAELDNLATETDLDAAMATMAPDTGGLTAASLGIQSQAIGLVDTRLDALRPLASAYGSGMATGNPAAGTGVWMQGFAHHGVQGVREGAAGFRAHTVGMAWGADRELLAQPWTMGVSYAYARSSLDFQETRSGNGTDVASHLAGLYASWDGGPYFVDVVANAGFNGYETIRQLSFGAIRREARGSFRGRQYSAKVTAGYTMNRQGYAVVPLASLQATRLDLDDYTESGADALNLRVAAQHYDYLQTGLGVRTLFGLKTTAGLVAASLKAMWLYDALSDPQTVTSVFSGAGGESFSVSAPAGARHALELGAGVRFEGNDGFSFVLQYDARIKDAYLGHAATATLQYRF